MKLFPVTFIWPLIPDGNYAQPWSNVTPLLRTKGKVLMKEFSAGLILPILQRIFCFVVISDQGPPKWNTKWDPQVTYCTSSLHNLTCYLNGKWRKFHISSQKTVETMLEVIFGWNWDFFFFHKSSYNITVTIEFP